MKLSNIKGPRTLDVVAELIGPVAEIAADPEAAELFKKKKLPDGMSVREFLMGRIVKSVPKLMKDHNLALITILATIEGVTPEAYAESLDLAKLVTDILDLTSDEAMLAFFISAQSGATPSASAPENTVEA